jgi:glycosyltransferase involved in cell wall biosynthesis
MQVQHGGQLSKKANNSVDAVAIVIPVLNEAAVMPRLLRMLQILDPEPAEIVAIDGGSQDKTAALVRQSGFVRLIEHAIRGRAAAINRGVLEIRSPLVCVLHADTILPDDGIAVIRATMQDPRITLAGFIALIVGAERVRWGTTFHNWIKTWYAPLIFRPHLFFRGCRLLFGDQAMFFRRSDFLAVGGCDETLTVMEDAGPLLAIVSPWSDQARQSNGDDLRPENSGLGRTQSQLDISVRRNSLGFRSAPSHRASLSRHQIGAAFPLCVPINQILQYSIGSNRLPRTSTVNVGRHSAISKNVN